MAWRKIPDLIFSDIVIRLEMKRSKMMSQEERLARITGRPVSQT